MCYFNILNNTNESRGRILVFFSFSRSSVNLSLFLSHLLLPFSIFVIFIRGCVNPGTNSENIFFSLLLILALILDSVSSIFISNKCFFDFSVLFSFHKFTFLLILTFVVFVLSFECFPFSILHSPFSISVSVSKSISMIALPTHLCTVKKKKKTERRRGKKEIK